MTREEAIKLLTNIKGYTHITLYAWLDVEKEAIDMAIEALQTKGVGRYENAMQKLREMPRYLNGVKEKRKAEPVKHGEWKCMADCGVTECDQCGWSIEEYVGDYNFCPNCGAKMDKGGDTE